MKLLRPETRATVTACAAVIAFAGLSAIGVLPASASTITNGDTVAYTLSIEEKTGRKSETLPPGEQLAGICSNSCIVRLEGVEDGEWRLDGDERVTIEGGLMYYDGQEGEPDQTDEAPDTGIFR